MLIVEPLNAFAVGLVKIYSASYHHQGLDSCLVLSMLKQMIEAISHSARLNSAAQLNSECSGLSKGQIPLMMTSCSRLYTNKAFVKTI